MLFLKETNEHIAVLEGSKLTKQQAYETSGVRTVYWLKDSDKIIVLNNYSQILDTIWAR